MYLTYAIQALDQVENILAVHKVLKKTEAIRSEFPRRC
jgi:hypothetical protein